MNNFQIIILLMSAAILLVGVAQKLKIPYPLALVIGGMIIGFIPGLPPIFFDPTLVLVITLPPILNYAAFWISFREFKRNWMDIFSLALGLVFVTMLMIGVIFKWLFPELPWALAFAFGAIVSPPDAVAATTIFKRFSLGPRLVTILEGESLINDASALVIYKLAIVALLTGVFSWADSSFEFAKVTLGGIVVGAISGFTIQRFSSKHLPAVIGVMFSFVIPYIVYIAADLLQTSGVLAVVTNGLFLSRYLIIHHEAQRRVLALVSWDIFVVLLNCFVFIIIGLELKVISKEMTVNQMLLYSAYGFLIMLVMMAVRMIWIYTRHGILYLRARQHHTKSSPQCTRVLREAAILGWSGMRGIVSLSAALALPLTLQNGELLVGREKVVFITFVVIFLTLIIPGLTLPTLLKWLDLHVPKTGKSLQIRKTLLNAALDKVHSLRSLNRDERTFLNQYFSTRHRVWEISTSTEGQMRKLETIRQKILKAQRDLLLKLWEEQEIDDKLIKRLELELDTEEALSLRAEIK